ncbi:MAG TPA: hypothetical protein VN476_14790, partial [Pyrinomonadaceae bacterium]|nr:hypothetical protein [Pyrinomonadaceae bacterium]
ITAVTFLNEASPTGLSVLVQRLCRAGTAEKRDSAPKRWGGFLRNWEKLPFAKEIGTQSGTDASGVHP